MGIQCSRRFWSILEELADICLCLPQGSFLGSQLEISSKRGLVASLLCWREAETFAFKSSVKLVPRR